MKPGGMKRPFVPVVLLYAVGILLAHSVVLPLTASLAAALACCAATLLWTRARLVLLCPLLILAGWANLTFHTAVISPNDLRRILGDDPEIVTARGTLSETPTVRADDKGNGAGFSTTRMDVSALSIQEQAWRPAFGRIAVKMSGDLSRYFAGQVVEVTGVAVQPEEAKAEGAFDSRAYLAAQGIYYELEPKNEMDWRVLWSPPKPPLADRFRAWARKALALGLPCEDEALRLEWALTLGWKPALTEKVAEPFVQASTYHIFAVDGLRMAIVFGVLLGLLRALGLPRATCGVVLLPLIWFYVALTGWPASAIRATVMLTVIIIGWALRRPSDLINSLFAAAFIILTWGPQQLFQAGFQLSFLVVLCLVLTIPVLQALSTRLRAADPWLPDELHPRWRRVLDVSWQYIEGLVITSFAAWLGALPLVARYFHIFTPVSTPANMLAVPLCALVLISNLASLLLAGWFPVAAQLFNHAGWALMQAIRLTSHWFANWPAAYFYVATPGLYATVLYYALLLGGMTGWLFQRKLRGWKIAAASLAVLIWGVRLWQDGAIARLSILAISGGQVIYSDPPDRKNGLLIDCGTTNTVASLTKPFLRSQGVNRLPGLVLTHGSVHEVGGAEMVARLFSPEKICASPVHFRSPAYRNIMADFSRTPEKLRTISRNDRVGPWTVLHPEPGDHFPKADDNTLVLFEEFKGTRLLLLSDLGPAGQNALLARTPDLRADIVVTGLPSTGEPLGDALLDAVQPSVIIVSDSAFPVANRASPNLRERLARRQVPVIYLRSAGTATIELGKDRWQIRTRSGTTLTSQGQKPARR